MNLQEIKEDLSRFVDWYAEDKKTNTDLQSKINKVFDYIVTEEIETAEKISELEKENKEQQKFVERIVKASADNPNEFFELRNEIAKLKKENKQIVERERVVPEHYLIEMIEKNKELKAQIEEQKAHCKAVDEVNEKMKFCGNCGHNGSDSEIGENGDYTDYTCIQCDDFSTKENPYPNWELAE